MADSNTSASAGTAGTQALPTQAELEDEIGAAFVASDEESEHADEEQPADAAEDEPDKATDDAEEKPEDEKKPDPDAEKPTTVRLKDGTEVTFDELERGFLRQSDYTRKTQEVAENNRALEAAAGRLAQRDQEQRQVLEFAHALIQARMPKAPDVALIQSDPVSYLSQKEAYDRAVSETQQIRQAYLATGQRQTEETAQKTQAELAAEFAVLTEKVPALKTSEGRATFYQKASEIGGKAYGFTPAEIGGIMDHRQLLVLNDAIAYRELQAKRMETVRAAKTAPPMKAAARRAPEARVTQARQAAEERLRRSGSIADAAAALPDEIFGI